MKYDLKLIVYDFDGVMTDNTVLVDQNGRESVRVNRGDGLAVSLIRKKGIPQLILSSELNDVVKKRAKKLRIPVIHNCQDKSKTLLHYCVTKRIALNKVLYVGNDINDYAVMMLVGVKTCPKDAHPKIKKISDLITKTCGGEGVIRELVDILEVESLK